MKTKFCWETLATTLAVGCEWRWESESRHGRGPPAVCRATGTTGGTAGTTGTTGSTTTTGASGGAIWRRWLWRYGNVRHRLWYLHASDSVRRSANGIPVCRAERQVGFLSSRRVFVIMMENTSLTTLGKSTMTPYLTGLTSTAASGGRLSRRSRRKRRRRSPQPAQLPRDYFGHARWCQNGWHDSGRVRLQSSRIQLQHVLDRIDVHNQLQLPRPATAMPSW